MLFVNFHDTLFLMIRFPFRGFFAVNTEAVMLPTRIQTRLLQFSFDQTIPDGKQFPTVKMTSAITPVVRSAVTNVPHLIFRQDIQQLKKLPTKHITVKTEWTASCEMSFFEISQALSIMPIM